MLHEKIVEYKNSLPSLEEYSKKSGFDIDISKELLRGYEITIRSDVPENFKFRTIFELMSYYDFSKINFAGFIFTKEITEEDGQIIFGHFDDMFITQNSKNNRIYLCPDMEYEELVCNSLEDYILVVLEFGRYSINCELGIISTELKQKMILRINEILPDKKLSERFVNMIPLS
jgi:hypothetical protein